MKAIHTPTVRALSHEGGDRQGAQRRHTLIITTTLPPHEKTNSLSRPQLFRGSTTSRVCWKLFVLAMWIMCFLLGPQQITTLTNQACRRDVKNVSCNTSSHNPWRGRCPPAGQKACQKVVEAFFQILTFLFVCLVSSSVVVGDTKAH